MARQPRPRLLLVGAGHAHIGLLRRLIVEAPPPVDLHVLNLEERHYYSGMIPGYLAGQYDAEEISFDVEALTQIAEGTFHTGRAVRIDTSAKTVTTEDGARLSYDIVSFNLGSRASGTDTPGVTSHAFTVKPFVRVRRLKTQLEKLAGRQKSSVPVAVVGGGAAGVEVACALERVLTESGRGPRVTLYEQSDRILRGYSPRFVTRAHRVLEDRRIEVRTGCSVVSVDSEKVSLSTGKTAPSLLTVWLTGAAAPKLFAASRVPTDDNGYLLVNDSLQAVSDEAVLGAGDCVSMESYPDLPKAGVYAVRQAPVLWRSIVALIEDGDLPVYEPQDGFLSILNTANGKALLRWKMLVTHSRWAFWLKDWIDRRFMRRHSANTLGKRLRA